MSRSKSLFVALCLTGAAIYASAAGTGGRAIPIAIFADGSGLRVGTVLVEVTAGWTNAPHSVWVDIISFNGTPEEPHGTEVHALGELAINGVISQGSAQVIIPWTSDANDTSGTHLYDVCARIIFADNHLGPITCTTELPLNQQ